MVIAKWPRQFFRSTIRELVETLVAIHPAPKERVLRLMRMAPSIGRHLLSRR